MLKETALTDCLHLKCYAHYRVGLEWIVIRIHHFLDFDYFVEPIPYIRPDAMINHVSWMN